MNGTWPQRILTRQFTAVDGRPQEEKRMQFRLTIDIGAEPSQIILAGQLHGLATLLWTTTEPLHPIEAQGVTDPRTMATVGKWEIVEEPKAGKTLADFANSGKLFKRPMHRNPYGFTAGSDHLREIRGGGTKNTFVDFARLTAEDLMATDWQEVTV
jgi:hypothetical protein